MANRPAEVPPKSQMAMTRQNADPETKLIKGTQAQVSIWLKDNFKHIVSLLPKDMTPERMARSALMLFREDPKLAMCDSDTVIAGIIAAAECGLVLGKAMKEAYLIPFKNQATFVVGIPGRIKNAMRSTLVRGVATGTIRERQGYVWDKVNQNYHVDEIDDNQPEKALFEQYGPITHYWASYKTAYGNIVAEKMPRAEIERRRASIPGRNSDAWTKHFDEQAQNMVLRHLLKKAPVSGEQGKIESYDGAVMRLDGDTLIPRFLDDDEEEPSVPPKQIPEIIDIPMNEMTEEEKAQILEAERLDAEMEKLKNGR